MTHTTSGPPVVSCESSRARPWVLSPVPTGSPRSKYEHQRASVLLRIIQNIRICMRRKPIVSVTYENERISIIKKKNSLPYLICVLRLSSVVHRPIYGRFLSLLCRKGKKAGHYIFSKFNPLNTDTRLYGQEVNRFSQKAKFANANT